MFDLRGVGNSLTPPRDRVSNSLLDASVTMAHLGWRSDCKAHPCDKHCFDEHGWGDPPAWAQERKYAKCKQFFEEDSSWVSLGWDGGGPPPHTCARGENERYLQECFACVDDGNIWNYDIRWCEHRGPKPRHRGLVQPHNCAYTTCTFSPENAEKKRKAEDKEREYDRHATEKRNQRLAQPALGSSPAIDGVHTTSFALGALVACTLGVVAYLVRRSRITKITDSSAYGATTVK